MFSQEINGYNKEEVDAFIRSMKASYEAKLMEEKLKTLESEKKVLYYKNERTDLENKEKNILNALSAIEKVKNFQEEGSKNFYKLIMDKLEFLIGELDEKFPQLRRDQNFADVYYEFTDMLSQYKSQLEKSANINRPIFSANDSMRVLLNKMQDYKKGQELPQSPKEVHIPVNRKTLQDIPVSESGFSFEEALNPTEDLAEIMKAFDFYNEK